MNPDSTDDASRLILTSAKANAVETSLPILQIPSLCPKDNFILLRNFK